MLKPINRLIAPVIEQKLWKHSTYLHWFVRQHGSEDWGFFYKGWCLGAYMVRQKRLVQLYLCYRFGPFSSRRITFLNTSLVWPWSRRSWLIVASKLSFQTLLSKLRFHCSLASSSSPSLSTPPSASFASKFNTPRCYFDKNVDNAFPTRDKPATAGHSRWGSLHSSIRRPKRVRWRLGTTTLNTIGMLRCKWMQTANNPVSLPLV